MWQAIDESDESALVGMCDDPDSFDFSAEQFEERSGCAVEMTWSGRAFIGGTDETSCESSLSGATYATAAVTLSPTMLTSWDRGFDDDGEQVWGAVDGPYQFVRRSAAPEED